MAATQVFDVQIAGLKIRIHARSEITKMLFKGYEAWEEREPDFHFYPSEEFAGNAAQEYIELHRELARRLSSYDRLLLHGAAIEYGGNGYLFVAPSGTGKSTHIRLWHKLLGKRVGIINGDKPILHVTDDKILICGTPWAGKERWQRNVSVPLGGICLLHRGENAIRRVEFSECMEELLREVFIPKEWDGRNRSIGLLEQALIRVPLYELHCDITEKAVQIAFEKLTGECWQDVSGGCLP